MALPAAWPGFFNRPLTIYIISPQPWDGFKVSKHHYATELASLGHFVVFIEPPNASGRLGSVEISSSDTPRIVRVSYTPCIPYKVKFYARWLFDAAMRLQARVLAKAVGVPPDVVWDFDNAGQFIDLRSFGGNSVRILHPVDDIGTNAPSKSAHLILSVSQVFLNRVAPNTLPKHVIPHALARPFEALARAIVESPSRIVESSAPCIGYVGNLEQSALDWGTILTLIEQTPQASFRFFGPFDENSRSVPLGRLRDLANVSLEGQRSPIEIANVAAEVDLWLVCYDPSRSTNAAINSHKILEYLSSGNPVLSHRVAEYIGNDLLMMPAVYENRELPGLLRELLSKLDSLHEPSLRLQRAAFALRHSYASNLIAIDQYVRAAMRRDSGGSVRGALKD